MKPIQRHEAEQAGHQKRPILKAIRENCIECSGGNQAEIRRCPIVRCALWPYRFGTNPFTSRQGNAAAFKAHQ